MLDVRDDCALGSQWSARYTIQYAPKIFKDNNRNQWSKLVVSQSNILLVNAQTGASYLLT